MAAKTDRQTDKSSRWQFTAYEDQWHLFETIPPGIAEWGWQKEMTKTQRPHYQGYLRTTSQTRMSALIKILPGVHLEVCGKNTPEKPQSECWKALVQYCKKLDTRVEGEAHVHVVNSMFTKYTYAEHVGRQLYAKHKQDEWETWLPNDLFRAMEQVIGSDITRGRREVAWIIVSPDWKLYWKSYKYILRSYSIDAPAESSWTRETPPQPQSQTPPSTPRPKPGDAAHTDGEDHGNN